jgi:hypothetical protein
MARVDIGRSGDGTRQRKYVYGATRQAVAQELNRLLGRQARGELFNTATPMVGVWLNSWFTTHKAKWPVNAAHLQACDRHVACAGVRDDAS